MELKPGSRWKSAVCSAEVVVVRPPKAAVELTCGGVPMVPQGADSALLSPPSGVPMGGVVIGKRYTDATSGLELLCVKGGDGGLAIDGRPVELKEAKRLPSSD